MERLIRYILFIVYLAVMVGFPGYVWWSLHNGVQNAATDLAWKIGWCVPAIYALACAIHKK